MNDFKLLPFYEKCLPGPLRSFLGKVFASAILGLAFLGPHYASIGNDIFNDWSWFLGALISVQMLCLFYGTHNLRTVFAEMGLRPLLRDRDYKDLASQLKHILSNRNFVIAGVFFGLVNCGLGYAFGPPYDSGSGQYTIYWGFFLSGFMTGPPPLLGIWCLLVSFRAFCQRAALDVTSPDHRAGTTFLGDALVVYSSLTLIIGVMISIYILLTPWQKHAAWITLFKLFWIGLPYVTSLLVLIAPAVYINAALRKLKSEEEIKLQADLTELRGKIEGAPMSSEKMVIVREAYEFRASLRADLHAMGTWPYSSRSNIKYLAVFLPNLFVSEQSAVEWLRNM